jgi:DNA-binding response OmpR family regulator
MCDDEADGERCDEPEGSADLSQPMKKTILVVDDDTSVREMVGRVLVTEGYRVLCAASGVAAVEIAEANHLDLVLLDLNMPGQGGWDTFEQLTAKDPLLAVIIITARPNQLFTSLGAGAGALLEKPFDYSKLLETVRSVLAEPARVRLARIAGHQTDFHYLAPAGKAMR